MDLKTKRYLKIMQIRQEKNNELQQRYTSDCSIRQVKGEGNERKFEISFSSEEPVKRWYGNEIISHADNAVDLTRLNSIGVVLFNHNRDEVVGKIIKAWIENNRGHAIIEFDEDEKSEVVYQKVKSGTLKGVSVAYSTEVWEKVERDAVSADGRFKGPCEIAKKWTPLEISIVSVPADPTVGVGRTYETKEVSSSYLAGLQLQINKNITGGN